MELVDFLVTELHRVPDVVSSGIMASVITLAGVMVSNHASDKRQREQLEHDSRERDRERTAALRRDVYLPAAEELVRATSHLSKMPMLDASKQSLSDGFSRFFELSTQAQLIADDETSGHIGEFIQLFQALVLRAIAKSQPLRNVATEIELATAACDEQRSEVERILAAMNLAVEAPQIDTIAVNKIQVSFEKAQARLQELTAEQLVAMQKRIDLHKVFVHDLFSEIDPVLDAQVPMLVALRRELIGVESDLEAFRVRQRASIEKLKSEFASVVATFEEDHRAG